MERSSYSLINVISQHLFGGTERITKTSVKDSRYSDLESNLAPPECESIRPCYAIPLHDTQYLLKLYILMSL